MRAVGFVVSGRLGSFASLRMTKFGGARCKEKSSWWWVDGGELNRGVGGG